MKKIIALLLVIVLTVTISVGATLAYLTDRDSKVNVFTIGDISVELNEEFEQGSPLIPGEKVTKEVSVTNTGKNDAWVWYTITYPKALDLTESGKTILWTGFATENHDNAGYDGYNDGEDEWLIEYTGAPYLRYFTDENGVEMVEFTILYQQPLAAEATTPISLECVYFDKTIDVDPEGNLYRVEKGVAEKIDWNITDDGAPVVYVSAYSIQNEGFNTVQEAFAAYQTQWGTNGTEYATTATEESSDPESGV